MHRLALARTVQAVLDDSSVSVNDKLMMEAVDHIDMITKRRNNLHLATAVSTATLASLQTKLLQQKGKVKLYEKLGEYLFLEGRLFAAREAFLLAIRFYWQQRVKF